MPPSNKCEIAADACRGLKSSPRSTWCSIFGKPGWPASKKKEDSSSGKKLSPGLPPFNQLTSNSFRFLKIHAVKEAAFGLLLNGAACQGGQITFRLFLFQ